MISIYDGMHSKSLGANWLLSRFRKICYLQFSAQYFKSIYAYIDTDITNLPEVFSQIIALIMYQSVFFSYQQTET